MKDWRLPLLIALASLGLAACEQEPPRTTVTPPQASLPDDAQLTPGAGTATATAPAPATTQPTTSGDNTMPAEQGSSPDGAAAAGTSLAAASAAPAASAAASAAVTDPAAQTAAAAASEPATAVASAPATAAMGAQPATVATPEGTAAPTELARFLEESASAKSGAAPAANSTGETGKSDAKPQARRDDKVSANLPAVRNPGDPEGARLLAQRALEVPVVGIRPTALSDNYEQSRGERKHEAIDILAPAGTPVVAVDDGRIAKLFTSKAGGLTVYQFDREQRLAYYYAHLQRYAGTVREGMDVRRGDLIGYVGSTGNASANVPHLHFAVFRLGNPPRWWQGEPVNPYPALSRAETADQVAVR